MANRIIRITRRRIASSNREWGAEVPGKGWLRGGSLANALRRAAEGIDDKSSNQTKIIVMPDKTSKELEDAYDRVGWR